MVYRLSDEQLSLALDKIIGDNPELLGDCINAIYADLNGAEQAENFHKQHMTPSCGILTVYDKEKALKICNSISLEIANKTVIEIGAGIGILACAMAIISKQVYAIEVDPAWSWGFTHLLFERKPPNLTWIFGKAETMYGILKSDVVIIVTRSGHEEMQEIGKHFSDNVIDVYERYPELGEIKIPNNNKVVTRKYF